MARPQKAVLNYFPLDCGFFTNQKIKALRRAHGTIGVMTYLNLLCKVYSNGYYLKIDSLEQISYDIAEEIANDRLAKVASSVTECVHYLADKGLIDKDSLDKGVITGRAIQEQYVLSLEKSKRKGQIQEYAISDSCITTQKKGIDSEETPVNTEETPVNTEEMQQSKIKESKLNEIECVYTPTLKKLFSDIKIDAEPKHTLEEYIALAEPYNQSGLAKTFKRISVLDNNYERLLAGEYKDFIKGSLGVGANPIGDEKKYTAEELNAMFDALNAEGV